MELILILKRPKPGRVPVMLKHTAEPLTGTAALFPKPDQRLTTQAQKETQKDAHTHTHTHTRMNTHTHACKHSTHTHTPHMDGLNPFLHGVLLQGLHSPGNALLSNKAGALSMVTAVGERKKACLGVCVGRGRCVCVCVGVLSTLRVIGAAPWGSLEQPGLPQA